MRWRMRFPRGRMEYRPGGQLLDVASPQQEDVAGHFGAGRDFPEGLQQGLGYAHFGGHPLWIEAVHRGFAGKKDRISKIPPGSRKGGRGGCERGPWRGGGRLLPLPVVPGLSRGRIRHALTTRLRLLQPRRCPPGHRAGGLSRPAPAEASPRPSEFPARFEQAAARLELSARGLKAAEEAGKRSQGSRRSREREPEPCGTGRGSRGARRPGADRRRRRSGSRI